MIGAWILAVIGGLVATFALNWIMWMLPDPIRDVELVEDSAGFLSTLISLGMGYMAGAIANLRTSRKHLKAFTILCMIAAAGCWVSWDYFNYLHYLQQVAKPEGFVRYVFLSAGSGLDKWVTWFMRSIALVLSVVWARKGLRIALAERARSGKATGEILTEQVIDIIDDMPQTEPDQKTTKTKQIEKTGRVSQGLAGVDLSHADLSGRDFQHRNLEGANFSYSNLTATNLRSSNMRRSMFTRCILDRTDLREADLTDVSLGWEDVEAIAWSPNSVLLCAGDGDRVLLWETKQFNLVDQLEGMSSAYSFAWDQACENLVISSGANSKLWKLKTREIEDLTPYDIWGRASSALSCDNRFLVQCGASDVISIWTLSDKTKVAEFRGASFSVVCHPSLPIAVWANGPSIVICDLEKKAITRKWEAHKAQIVKLIFSEDGNRLVSGAWARSIKIWDWNSAELLKSYTLSTGDLSSVSCSMALSERQRIIAAAARELVLLNMDTSEFLVLQGHKGSVHSVDFSPNGDYLASGGSDGTVRIWDMSSGLFAPVQCAKVLDTRMNCQGALIGGAKGLEPRELAFFYERGAVLDEDQLATIKHEFAEDWNLLEAVRALKQ